MPSCKLVSAPSSSPKPLISYMRNPEKAIDPVRYKETHGQDFERANIREAYGDITVSSKTLINPSDIEAVCNSFRSIRLSANDFRSAEKLKPINREYMHQLISYEPSEVKDVRVLQEHLERTMNEFAPDTHYTASLHKVNYMRLENRAEEFAWHWHVCMNTVTNGLESIPTEKIWERLRDISDKHAQELGLKIIENPDYHPAFSRESREERAIQHRTRNDEHPQELMITTVRKRVEDVFKCTKSADMVDLAAELQQSGVMLCRPSEILDGGLVYGIRRDGEKLRNGNEMMFIKASKLGSMPQSYGIRCLQSEGYERATEMLRELSREDQIKPLNIIAAHSGPAKGADYAALPIMPGAAPIADQEQIMRAMMIRIVLANDNAKTEKDFRHELEKLGIVPVENDGRTGYMYRDTMLADKRLPEFARWSTVSAQYGERHRQEVASRAQKEPAKADAEKLAVEKGESTLNKQNRIEREAYYRDIGDGRGGDGR